MGGGVVMGGGVWGRFRGDSGRVVMKEGEGEGERGGGERVGRLRDAQSLRLVGTALVCSWVRVTDEDSLWSD